MIQAELTSKQTGLLEITTNRLIIIYIIRKNRIMAGNHRDKCGAAMVAGFFKTLSLLKPKGINAYGTMCVARNNVGESEFLLTHLKIDILII